jgi:hypothetical protein
MKNLLPEIDAGHYAGSDGYALAAERVADDVHRLLQAGARTEVQLHRALPESRFFHGYEGEIHLNWVSSVFGAGV